MRSSTPAAAKPARALAQFSELQRSDQIAGQTISIWIYRFDDTGWWLRAVSSYGASVVWRERFATDAMALAEYERTVSEHGGGFIAKAGEQAKGMDGLNPALLQPQDVAYSSGRGFLRYTLRTFAMLQKYAGLWPVQSMLGHSVTGYLYKEDAPDWPHPVKGIPGAPPNLVVEFTVPVRHIETHVEQELGMKKVLPKTGQWWR